MPQHDKKKRKGTIMRTLKVREVSAVDRPMQGGARVTLMKRDDDLSKYHNDMRNPTLLSDVDGHAHLIDNIGQGGESTWTVSEGADNGHSHPWVRNEDGSVRIGAAEGHTHTALTKVANKDDLPNGQAKIDKAAGDESGGGTETGMDKDKPAAVEKQLEEATQKNADLEKRLERSEAISKLSQPERSHFDGLDEGGQDEFLKMNEGKRASVLKNLADQNPIVYTATDGTEFRKNDDPRLVKMAREREEDRKELTKQREENDRQRLEKRADDELVNLPGDADVKVAVLKAVESIKDEKVREGADALLKAGNDALKGAFTRRGTTESGGDSTPSDEIDTIAKGIREKSPELTPEQAYSKALETEEGRVAYEKIHSN